MTTDAASHDAVAGEPPPPDGRPVGPAASPKPGPPALAGGAVSSPPASATAAEVAAAAVSAGSVDDQAAIGRPASVAASRVGRRPSPTSRRGRAVARRRAAGLPPLPPRRPRPEPGGEALTGTAEGGRRGARFRRVDLRRRRLQVLAGMGALTIAGVALAVAGLSAVRNSTAGSYQQALGPTEPGYQASVVPTPTLGVLLLGGDGHLAGAVVLALEPGDVGGNAMVVPAAAVVAGADGAERTLDEAYQDGGTGAATEALGRVSTVALGETVALGPDAWAQLVEPVGSVTVQITDAVADWPAGEVELEPEDVGRFLAALGADEEELARTERQEAFWDAWLPLVQDAGEGALPGEVETGLGRFVRAIANGGGSTFALPVFREDGEQGVQYRTDNLLVGEMVASLVPYPVSPEEGVRTRVRLLNGTGSPELTDAASRVLVAFGAEIAIVGNAGTFTEPETRLVYADRGFDLRVDWMVAGLGIGTPELVGGGQDGGLPDDAGIDVTVILGQDAVDNIGREQTSD